MITIPSHNNGKKSIRQRVKTVGRPYMVIREPDPNDSDV